MRKVETKIVLMNAAF